VVLLKDVTQVNTQRERGVYHDPFDQASLECESRMGKFDVRKSGRPFAVQHKDNPYLEDYDAHANKQGDYASRSIDMAFGNGAVEDTTTPGDELRETHTSSQRGSQENERQRMRRNYKQSSFDSSHVLFFQFSAIRNCSE